MSISISICRDRRTRDRKGKDTGIKRNNELVRPVDCCFAKEIPDLLWEVCCGKCAVRVRYAERCALAAGTVVRLRFRFRPFR
jgi:hypothetical protein